MAIQAPNFPSGFGAEHYLTYIFLSMTAADGQATPEEIQMVLDKAESWFGGKDGLTIVTETSEFIASLSGEQTLAGMLVAIALASHCPAEHKRLLFQEVSEIAGADGHIHEMEEAILDLLKNAWEI